MGAVPRSRQKQGQEGIWAIRLIDFRVRQGCLTRIGLWLGWEHITPVCGRPGFSCLVSPHTEPWFLGYAQAQRPFPGQVWAVSERAM